MACFFFSFSFLNLVFWDIGCVYSVYIMRSSLCVSVVCITVYILFNYILENYCGELKKTCEQFLTVHCSAEVLIYTCNCMETDLCSAS